MAAPAPRGDAVVGEQNQLLPLLADGQASIHQTGTHLGRVLANDEDAILAASRFPVDAPLRRPVLGRSIAIRAGR